MKGNQSWGGLWGGVLTFEDGPGRMLEGKPERGSKWNYLVQDHQFFWEFLITREKVLIFPDT